MCSYFHPLSLPTMFLWPPPSGSSPFCSPGQPPHCWWDFFPYNSNLITPLPYLKTLRDSVIKLKLPHGILTFWPLSSFWTVWPPSFSALPVPNQTHCHRGPSSPLEGSNESCVPPPCKGGVPPTSLSASRGLWILGRNSARCPCWRTSGRPHVRPCCSCSCRFLRATRLCSSCFHSIFLWCTFLPELSFLLVSVHSTLLEHQFSNCIRVDGLQGCLACVAHIGLHSCIQHVFWALPS